MASTVAVGRTTGGEAAGATRAGSARAGAFRTSALLAVALAVALASFTSVLQGAAWWFVAVAVMIIVFGGAALARQVSHHGWAATVTAIVLGVGTITLFFAADTAILGVIPTVGTWNRFVDLSQQATTSISEQSVPADAVVAIVFLICWSSAAIAILMDAVALCFRAPALSGIPVLVMLLVPNIIVGGLADPLFFAATALVYLLLLRQRPLPGTTSVALVIGAVSVLGAVIMPSALPPVVPAASGGLSGAISTGVNPIINLGQNLRRGVPTEALTYRTSALGGLYLRVSTLEDFRGTQWAPAPAKPITGESVKDIAAAPGLNATVATKKVTTTVTIDNTNGQWLPVPYPATSVSGLAGSWFSDPDGLTVRSLDANMRGQVYTVKSLIVQPTLNQLEAAGDSSSSPLAQVPKGLDPYVARTALQVVGNAATDFDKAVALQNWFRGGTFTYSEKAPVKEGFDGSGLDVLVPFLKAKTGYCVHFASAMAVMARTLGIPSRVVVGFLPGAALSDPPTANTVYAVSSRDLHAWPELYFQGVGWIRFEPTPGRGVVPTYQAASVDNAGTLGANDAQTTTVGGPTAVPSSKSSITPTDAASARGRSRAVGTILGEAALIIVGVLLLCALPAFVRLATRRRRFAAVRHGEAGAMAAWREIVDTARDLGYTTGVPASPRALAALLVPAAGMSGDSLAAITALRTAVEREAYAPAATPGGSSPNSSDAGETSASATVTLTSVLLVLAVLRRHQSTAVRLRATLLPPTVADRSRRFLARRGVVE
jgi:transglutaminase-like putative cysteine protease